MSDLVSDQEAVVASLQKRLKDAAEANHPAGQVKDIALALAVAVDKRAVLREGKHDHSPPPARTTLVGELGPITAREGKALVAWADGASSYVYLGVEIDSDANARLIVLDFERQPPLPATPEPS
jgi:hypothetical protein